MPEVENKNPSSPPESIHADEILIRIILHPDHIDDAGNLKNSAISSEQFTKGISVDRKLYVNKDNFEINIQNQVSRKTGRTLSRFGLIKHSAILNINDTNSEGALHAKADPIPDNSAHALILLKKEYQPAEIKKIRKALFDEFKLVNNIEDALR